MHLRLGQGLAVYFLVYVEGDDVYLHGDGGYHVGRFAFQDKGVKRLDVNLFVAYHIGGHELAAALLVEGLHGDVADVREFPDDGFHFLEFNAESADFHLGVLPADKFDVSVFTVAHDVSGAVQAPVSGVFVKGVVQEGLGRFFGLAQVTVAHLLSGGPEFAGGTGRQQGTAFGHHIGADARQGLADRDILFGHLHFFAQRIAQAFAGAVAVEQAVVGKLDPGHFLAAGKEHFQAFALRIGAYELHGHLCGHQHMRDAVFFVILVQGGEVQADFFGDDVKAGAADAGVGKVSHKGVKAEAGIGRQAGAGADAQVHRTAPGIQG